MGSRLPWNGFRESRRELELLQFTRPMEYNRPKRHAFPENVGNRTVPKFANEFRHRTISYIFWERMSFWSVVLHRSRELEQLKLPPAFPKPVPRKAAPHGSDAS